MNQKVNIARFQSGLTIVELMVSLAIGLVLMGGMVQIFATNKSAYRYNNSIAEVQNNGAYALEFVVNQIAQIGYVPTWVGYQERDRNGDGLRNRNDMEIWAYGATPPFIGFEGGAGASDSILISTFVDPNDPAPMDCVGNVVPVPGTFIGPLGLGAGGAPGYGFVNMLAVATNAAGISMLTCNGVAVAEGVENMQILYGVDTANLALPPPFRFDGIVDQYMTFSEIAAPNTPLNILSVRVSLLVASNEQARKADNTKTNNLLDTPIGPAKDRKLRNVYTATVRLRNRCVKFPSSATSICA